MPSKPLLAPYRENNTIKYVPTPSISSLSSPASGSQTQTQTITTLSSTAAPPTPYDSDNEPLLAPQPETQELTADEILHFTATGRPMPVFKMSGLANLAGPYANAPQLLPVRYTDESVIPAIIVDVIPKCVADDGAAEP
ncbi:hypothetical protein B7494_g2127 [Chlorociboria aeruginascens]|nr:hypothetical protein B7494_g2127 [Chlorociboria aeruginascens]